MRLQRKLIKGLGINRLYKTKECFQNYNKVIEDITEFLKQLKSIDIVINLLL